MSIYKIMSREGDTLRIPAPKDVFGGEFLVVNGQPVMALEDARLGSIAGFLKRGQVAYSARYLPFLKAALAPATRGILKGLTFDIIAPGDRDPDVADEMVAGCQSVYPHPGGDVFLGYVNGFDDKGPGGGRWLIGLGDALPVTASDLGPLEARMSDVEQVNDTQDFAISNAFDQANLAYAAALAADPDALNIRQKDFVSIPAGQTYRVVYEIVAPHPAIGGLQAGQPTHVQIAAARTCLLSFNVSILSAGATSLDITTLLNGDSNVGFQGKLRNAPLTNAGITTFIRGPMTDTNFLTIDIRNTGASAVSLDNSGSGITIIPIAK